MLQDNNVAVDTGGGLCQLAAMHTLKIIALSSHGPQSSQGAQQDIGALGEELLSQSLHQKFKYALAFMIGMGFGGPV